MSNVKAIFSSRKKVITKVKVFQKKVKVQGQDYKVINNSTTRKVFHKQYTCAICKPYHFL